MHQVQGEMTGGVIRAKSEAQHGAEAVGGGQSDKVKAGHAGLKITRQHRGVFESFQTRADFFAEETQAAYVSLVTGGEDDVIGGAFESFVLSVFESEAGFAGIDLDLQIAAAEEHWNFSHHAFAHGPSGRGIKYFFTISSRVRAGSKRKTPGALQKNHDDHDDPKPEDGRRRRSHRVR